MDSCVELFSNSASPTSICTIQFFYDTFCIRVTFFSLQIHVRRYYGQLISHFAVCDELNRTYDTIMFFLTSLKHIYRYKARHIIKQLNRTSTRLWLNSQRSINYIRACILSTRTCVVVCQINIGITRD